MAKKDGDLVSNRRALHDYEIIETYEAGIVLTGTEIKSLRDNGGSLQDAYVRPINNEVWLLNCSIVPYKFGNINNHEDRRDRKLLMHKREIETLRTQVQIKGMALIPLGMYLKNGRVKVKIAVARGKKSVDKRASIKEKDDKRQMQRMMKSNM